MRWRWFWGCKELSAFFARSIMFIEVIVVNIFLIGKKNLFFSITQRLHQQLKWSTSRHTALKIPKIVTKNNAARNKNRKFTWHFKSPFYFISMQLRIWDMLNSFLISLTLLHSVIKYASEHNTDLYDMFHSSLNFFSVVYYFSFLHRIKFQMISSLIL